MAEFAPAFERMIQNEGGYRLTTVKADRGGQTYAGIARNFFPHWPGWRLIDANDTQAAELSGLVRDFYDQQFWTPISGDAIANQMVAEALFDFAVNAGVATATKLAQLVVGTTPDGHLGNKTLEALNAMEAESFVLRYTLAKVARYATICNRDSSQRPFLLGWINRALKGLS